MTRTHERLHQVIAEAAREAGIAPDELPREEEWVRQHAARIVDAVSRRSFDEAIVETATVRVPLELARSFALGFLMGKADLPPPAAIIAQLRRLVLLNHNDTAAVQTLLEMENTK